MYFQVGCLCERTSAAFQPTDKGFFACVDAPVFFQVSVLYERTSTVFMWTDKGLASDIDSVGSQVPLQVCGSSEFGAAVVTRVDMSGSHSAAGAGRSRVLLCPGWRQG